MEYRLTHNHDFDWENVKILNIEGFLNKRLISEMLQIKFQITILIYNPTQKTYINIIYKYIIYINELNNL